MVKTKKTPVEININYLDYRRINVNGYPIYHMYVKGSDYIELPIDANVREPSEGSRPYKEMIDTLERKPTEFLLRNSGINVICPSVNINDSQKIVEMNFPSGTGIVNGGHTQLAILNTKRKRDISDAIILLEIIEHDFGDDELALIAASRNTNTNVTPYSIAEKKGLFKKIKDHMKPGFEKHIIWYENRPVPNGKGINAVDLIALLNLFNIKLYQSILSMNTIQPNKSATAKTSVFKTTWMHHSDDFLHTYPLIDDIINLQEHIQTTFYINTLRGFTNIKVIKNVRNKNNKTIFLGNKIEYKLPKQFLLPLLASYRANVRYDEHKNKIGWYHKPEELFDKTKKKVLKELATTYKTHSNQINKLSKDVNLWRVLYDTVSRNVDETKCWKMYDIPK